MITRAIPPLPEPDLSLFDAEIPNDPSSVYQPNRLSDLRLALTHFDSMDASGVRDENNPADTVVSRRDKQQAEHNLAYAYFARAYFGAAALRAEGVYEPGSAYHKEAWNQFQDFKRAYESPRKAPARLEYWKQLTKQIGELERTRQERPDRRAPDSKEYPKSLGKGAEAESPLETREKLQVLSERDQRAGFLPTTHREKNSALALLNYLDTRNPLYSGKREDSVNDYLDEIYQHQLKESSKKYNQQKQQDVGPVPGAVEHARHAQTIGLDAVRSVINEWDDYRSSALYSMNELSLLMDIVNEFGSPSTTFAELLEDAGTVLDPQPFLRYLDLKRFRDTGELPAVDPLATREIRPAPASYPGKNKLVTDPYFNVADIDARKAEFTAALNAITVKTIRELAREAAIDSRKRYAFFDRVLKGITGPYKPYADTAGQDA